MNQTTAEEEAWRLSPGAEAILKSGISIKQLMSGQFDLLMNAINEVCDKRVAEALNV